MEGIEELPTPPSILTFSKINPALRSAGAIILILLCGLLGWTLGGLLFG